MRTREVLIGLVFAGIFVLIGMVIGMNFFNQPVAQPLAVELTGVVGVEAVPVPDETKVLIEEEAPLLPPPQVEEVETQKEVEEEGVASPALTGEEPTLQLCPLGEQAIEIANTLGWRVIFKDPHGDEVGWCMESIQNWQECKNLFGGFSAPVTVREGDFYLVEVSWTGTRQDISFVIVEASLPRIWRNGEAPREEVAKEFGFNLPQDHPEGETRIIIEEGVLYGLSLHWWPLTEFEAAELMLIGIEVYEK